MADHPLNRRLFIADNLNLLRALDKESIDLICIDPPFAKNQTFTGSLKPPLTDEERQRELDTLGEWDIHNQHNAENAGIEWPDADNTGGFSDIWRWEDDVHEDWVNRIEDDYPALAKVIDATRTAHSEDMAAYLTYMAIRIIEMYRVLKLIGGIYLHCDTTASHYLKMTMDAIFGVENFKNEIVWKRPSAHSDAKACGRTHDIILAYAKEGAGFTWNKQYQSYAPEYVKSHYRYKTEEGRLYRTDNLTATGLRGGGYEWNGVIRIWRRPRESMEALHNGGRIRYTRNGVAEYIRYLDEMPGVPLQDVCADMPPINSQARERTGYPTQKPVALAERIIKASSNPGDVVLDCFAGCAYVPVAAERNGRQ